MASGEVTICLPFFNDRRQGLVISADNAGSYAKNPASHFVMAMRTSATCNYAADLPRHYSGVVAKFNRKDWAVERGVTSTCRSEQRHTTGLTLPVSFLRAFWFGDS